MENWAFFNPKTIFTKLLIQLCSDIVGKKGNHFAVTVLFDVDYFTMGEFEGQAAVTESGAV